MSWRPWRKPAVSHLAAHEAAHAVVALAVGRAVNRVSIIPAGDFAGVCELAPASIPLGGEIGWLVNDAVIRAAGAAGARALGHRARLNGPDRDTLDSISATMSIGVLEQPWFSRWARVRARLMVRDLRSEIAAVARALDEEHVLFRDEIRLLVPALPSSAVALRSFAIDEPKPAIRRQPAARSRRPETKARRARR